MITRYARPIFECGWTCDSLKPESPYGTAVGIASAFVELAAVVDRYMTVEKIVTAHLETRSPLQWLDVLHRERRRAELAECRYESVMGALLAASDFQAGVDAVHAIGTIPENNIEAMRAGLETMVKIIQDVGPGND